MASEADGLRTWKKTRDARIRSRNGWYWARFSRKGTRVEESLETKSFELAVRLVGEIEQAIHLGVNWKKERELFDTAWPEFIEDKAKGIKTRRVRESTLKQYLHFGDKYFLPFFKEMRVDDMGDDAWTKYVEWVKKESGDVLLFNHRKYLSGFISWALKKGKIRERPEFYNPDATEGEDDQEGPGKEFTHDELARMRELATGPFKLAIYMAQYMGMRRSEITQLNKNRISWDDKTINLRKVDTKIGHGRAVPIHPIVEPMLRSQCEAFKGSPFVFPNRHDPEAPMDPGGFKKPWAALKKASGVTGRFHDFKHTFITLALRSGMNPVVVSEIVGTSIRVIQTVYLHLKPADLYQDLAKLQLDRVGQNWDKGQLAGEP